MRGRGDVLLLACYELGHQPLALASPLAFLAAAGFDADALDLSVESLDDGRIRRARVVAISVPMHTALRLGVRVAERVRALNPGAHICFYGLYAALNSEHLLSGTADSAIAGEVETPLVSLVEALERGEAVPIPGVNTVTERTPPALERQSWVVPRRDRLPPLQRYAALIDETGRHTAGYVEASRGCLHLCRHCPIVPVYGGRLFVVPSDVVLADAAAQVAAGAKHLTFGDPDFLCAPTHALRVARALHELHPHVTFDITVKVEHILRHERRFDELGRLGCAFVVSAIESLDADVLRSLAKGHTAADVERALAILDRAGIPLRPTFVPFTPWSGLEAYITLLDWIDERGLVDHIDPIQLAIRLLVPPGSRLLELPAAEGWPGPLDADAFSHRWRHRDARVDALQELVAARVELGMKHDEPAAEVLAAVRAIAVGLAGGERTPGPLSGVIRPRPPRLSEAWFC